MAHRSARLSLAVLALLGLVDSAVGQQVEIVSMHAQGPDDTRLPASDLDDLEGSFRQGDFANARKAAQKIIDKAAKGTNAPAYDYRTHVLAVLWAGSDAAGDPVIRRMLLPTPAMHASSLDLPGLRPGEQPPQLFEVLLTLDKRSTLVSQYTFAREDNPLRAQIPSVAEALVGPLFGFVAATLPLGGERVQELGLPHPSVWAIASRVAIPFDRATVTVKSVARIPIAVTEWEGEVVRLSEKLAFQLVPRSELARGCSDRYRKDALTVAAEGACRGSEACAGDCLRAFDAAFTKTYMDCRGSAVAETDIKALELLDDEYRELVATGRAARTEGSAEFRNKPRTHFSFGLGTALIMSASLNKERAKLDDAGTLVLDPLPRQMTMLMLQWSPRGYDADAPGIQTNERWRLFAAGVLTPDIGVAAGGSILVVRGLGVNAGGGILFARSPSAGDAIGSAPSSTTDAFGLARGWITFAGINVAFK